MSGKASHSGFPRRVIIGDPESVFHRHTVVGSTRTLGPTRAADLNQPHRPIHIEHIGFVLRRPHADLEIRLLRILRIKEDEANAEDPAERVEPRDVVFEGVGRDHDVPRSDEERGR